MGLVGGVAINIVSEIMTGASPGAVLIAAPLVLIVAVDLWDRWRRYRQRRIQDLGLVAPDTPIRPAWFRQSRLLHDREHAVQRGANLLERHSATAVVGDPGTGSSAVAAAVVDELVERKRILPANVAPFDLRGWAWEPDSALTLASHLLPAFGLTAPVTEEELPHAGDRLRQVLVANRVLLVLDNLTEPSQIDWLIGASVGAPDPQPTLLVAGRPALVEAFDQKDHVELRPLGDDALRFVWADRMDHADRAGRSAPWSPHEHFLDAVLPYCAGLPKAVHDLAREFTRPGAPWTPDELVHRLATTSATGAAPGMAAVWTAILDRTSDSLSRRGRLLLGALAELPVTELTVEAIEAVRGSLDELIQILERGAEYHTAGSPDTPPDPVAELRGRRLIRETPSGRYRLPQEIRSLVRASSTSAESRASALVGRQALVRHYAGLARTWMFALDTPEEAAAAARWFHTTEPLLQALLSGVADTSATVWEAASDAEAYVAGDAEFDLAADATSNDQSGLLGDAGDRLVDDLCILTDALDRWRGRASRPMPAGEPPAAFLELVRQAKRPELEQLAAIRAATALREACRLADAEDALARAAAPPLRFWRRWPPWRQWRRNYTNALRARRHHEAALGYIALARRADDPIGAGDNLRRAEGELQLAWSALPAKDVHGQMTTLLTMAEVFLRQGVPDSALERLDIAETRAAEGEDPSGLAQVAELRGVAAWMQGRSSAAVVLWQRGLTEFSRLADQQGQARCLQHLGSAVLVAPELTGLVLDERRRPHDEAAAAQHAQAWLERSQRLRTGPVSAVAEHYLDLARARARRGDDAVPSAVNQAEELPAESGPSRTERPRGFVARLLAAFGRRTP